MTPGTIDVDRIANENRQRVLADRAAANGTTKATGGTSSGRHRKRSDQQRWAMLNTFVDLIAPRLTLVERAVWLVMFRYARNGVCETSERSIATQASIDKASAGKALRRLVDLGLAWPVFKSSSKGTPSRYGLHPRPDACLSAVIAADETRCRLAHERREQRGGDGRGRCKKVEQTG